jgi:NAD(P)-dependent dehydrogenase (short-subunit alcohol dehydrogenase family)
MHIVGQSVLVTGGASGLGSATARRLTELGARAVIADLPTSQGRDLAAELGEKACFVPTDVTDAAQVAEAVSVASAGGRLRALVHTAGRGGAVRLVNKDGSVGDLERFSAIVQTNLLGTFIVASTAAAAMARNEPIDGERGVMVWTASIAAFEGQIGQAGYAASKAGVVGLTLCAARDLASKGIRVCTIAPGLMDTPMLAGLRDDVRESLSESVPHPARLGSSDEYAGLACSIIENAYLNGETVRLDGANRMSPR